MLQAAAAADGATRSAVGNLTLILAPHAPLLLPEVAGPGDPCAASRAALVTALGRRTGACFVIVSPHASQTGVYARAVGDLGSHGLPQIVLEAQMDERAADLPRSWGHPMLQDPVDHGVLVPVALMPEGSFICCGISETAPDAEKHAAGVGLAEAINEVMSSGSEVVLVVSAHSAASLTPRAPLTERTEGAAFDAALLELLRNDPARLAAFEAIDEALWTSGGSCGRGPFAALGRAAALANCPDVEVLSYEAPVGVGYLVGESAR